MEPRRVNETESESKCLSASREPSSGHAAVTHPSDVTNDAPHEPPPSGKLRRTALRLFGGRKSICVLPNFFGGRNKNQNKWSSKKGVRKSRTHDGLCKANWEDGFAPAGDFEYHIEKDGAGNSVCGEFEHPIVDQKSMSLPRQKRGLRGLFNSIRRHKKNRNVELEKQETVPMYFVCSKEVPVAQVNVDQNNIECLGSLTEPYVPDLNANTGVDEPEVPECTDVGVMVSEKTTKQELLNVSSENRLEEEVDVKNNDSPDSNKKLISNTFDLLPNNDPESATNSQLSVGSSDQISLIFGDVASLKSFDSLTGCGDIIADQDDDSIAESTVSGERSRNGGKRSSCYVTYQGGGEDMATPDEVDLQDLWENEAAEEVSFNHNQKESLVELSARLSPEEPSSCLYTDAGSTGTLGVTDNTGTSVDVLTPQSDHQESVPNSDEGYYDSTTPGPDEEGQEKEDRMRRDRLPRDSYSGDALYELFGPDDSLISPAFENQLKLTSPVIHGHLDKSSDVKEHPVFGPEMGSLEFENPSLTRILLDLHSAKLPSDSSKQSKELALFTKGLSLQGLNKSMTSKAQASVDPVTSEAFNQGQSSQHGNKFANLKSEPHEQSSEKSKIMAPQSKNNKNTSKQKTAEIDDDPAVSFSQALVDFTKNAHLFGSPTEGMSGSESNSPFAQNLQALPAMVTFDVVDMENEGEYDQQVDMTIEEDIASPYEGFEESYLQKDAFAECDDRMFDLLSNTWAITSLPRHLSLTPANQATPSRLALNRRSRSLDTDCLELEMTNIYLGSGAVPPSCHGTERASKRVSSLHRKKNGHTAATETRDSSSFMFLSWQQEAERSSVSTVTDGRRAENTPGCRATPARHASPSGQPGGQNARKSQQQSVSIIAERMSCSFNSQNTGLMNRPCHLPLQSEASVTQAPCVFSGVHRDSLYVRSDLASDGGGEELFYTSSLHSQSSGQLCKMRAGGLTLGGPLSISLDLDDGDRSFSSRARPAMDTGFPLAGNKHTAGANPQPDLPTPLHNT